ncbi:VOC family protein [Leekyejoonella antrihumi]|uniref:VOC family protein n=1 Tax=Leekyejoonella antrihumi TaxID=1660198 RepID=UPI001C97A9EC|nr:VOC family protein [Leekyejoonella antrihumi]
MSTLLLNVTFDCADAAATARFWSGVMRWPCTKEEMPGNPYWLVGASDESTPRLVFVEVPETKTVKNRVHLDVVGGDGSQDEEVLRIERLGGQVLDDRRQASPRGWVVMADPEGNEFCVEGGWRRRRQASRMRRRRVFQPGRPRR